MDFHGDHTSTCTAHSGATKAHDWMVSVLGPLFRTAGHIVRTQHGVAASAGQRRGDVEIRNYLRDQAGSRSLVFDLSIAHDRFGSSSSHVQQNGCLSATVPDPTLRVEMNNLEEQADNDKARELFWKPLSWLGAIRPTSANDAFDPALWETFVSTTLGLELTEVQPRRTTGW